MFALDWNAYLKELTYTCPEGSVLEYPNETNEQTNDITEVMYGYKLD